MQVVQFAKTHKVITGVVLVDLILLVTIVVLGVLKFTKTAVIDVLVAPATAVVEIDGRSYGTGAYRMYPGEVKATISAEGFEPKTVTLELKSGETTKIYDYLEPVADNTYFYAKNTADAEIMARVGGEEADKTVKILSIRDILPIIDFQYAGLDADSIEIVIDQDSVCDATFCLMVTGDTSAGHSKTLEMIREKGYNPEDYKIRYVEE